LGTQFRRGLLHDRRPPRSQPAVEAQRHFFPTLLSRRRPEPGIGTVGERVYHPRARAGQGKGREVATERPQKIWPKGQKTGSGSKVLLCALVAKRPWKGLAAGMRMDSRRELSHGENSLKLAFRKRFLALPRGRTRGLPRRANVRQGVPRCAESAGRALDRLRVAAVSLAGCARR